MGCSCQTGHVYACRLRHMLQGPRSSLQAPSPRMGAVPTKLKTCTMHPCGTTSRQQSASLTSTWMRAAMSGCQSLPATSAAVLPGQHWPALWSQLLHAFYRTCAPRAASFCSLLAQLHEVCAWLALPVYHLQITRLLWLQVSCRILIGNALPVSSGKVCAGPCRDQARLDEAVRWVGATTLAPTDAQVCARAGCRPAPALPALLCYLAAPRSIGLPGCGPPTLHPGR